MLRRLYYWTLSLRCATMGARGVSGAVSSHRRAPSFRSRPDAMLVPMALARPDQAFFYAFITTIHPPLQAACSVILIGAPCSTNRSGSG